MFATFNAIFEALNSIESELSGGVSEERREVLINTLVSLRNTMDKCVQYWLKFEERINEMQERYSINLPDNLPPGFLEIEEQENDRYPGDAPEFGLNLEKKREEGPAEIYSEIAVNSFRKGLGFWDLAMLKEAVEEFKKVVEQEPNLTLGHFCLGLSSAQLGKVEEAFRELKLVLALDENQLMRALALNTLGILLAEKEEYEQALHFFTKATEAHGQLKEAWFNRAASCYNMQRYEEAVEYFEKARELSEPDWEIELYLGRALCYLGEYEEAVQALEAAYHLNPKEPVVSFELGVVNRMLGNLDKARFYFHITRNLVHSKV